MKTILSVIAGLVLAPAVLGAAVFEGRVAFKLSSGRGQSQEINYALKSGKMRMEMPGERGAAMASIVDPVRREIVVLMPEQRRYMVMPMQEPEATTKANEASAATFEKTNETERILGYATQKYISKQRDGSTAEFWITEDLGSFVMPSMGSPMGAGGRGGGAAAPLSAYEKYFAGKSLFPLRMVVRDKSGKEQSRMEVVQIDKQALPDAMFSPPADYEKFDMGAMMQGAMPGMMRKKG